MPDDANAQHSDSDRVTVNPNVDKLDSPNFRSALVSAIDKVRAGEIVTPQTRSATSDQRSEETPADSRGSDDDFSDTADDMTDASEIWDEEMEGTPTKIDDPDDGEEDGDDGDVDDADEGASNLEDDDATDQDADDADEGDDDDDYQADDDQEDDGEDEGGGIEEKLTAKERREIQKDPRLRKLAASLNKHATQQFMQNKQLERELKAQEADHQNFLERLNSPQRMADFMGELMEKRPDVGGAAFNKALNGEEQIDVLIEIGRGNPKVMDKAIERLELLRSDKGAMRNHEEHLRLKMERQEVQVEKIRLAQKRTNREMAKLGGILEREISRARIPKDYHDRVANDLRSQLRDKVGKDGSVEFTADDVRMLVRDHRDAIERDRKYALRIVRREQMKSGQRATKRKATKTRKRRTNSAPRSRAPNRSASSKPKRGGRKKGMSFDQMIQAEVMSRIGS